MFLPLFNCFVTSVIRNKETFLSSLTINLSLHGYTFDSIKIYEQTGFGSTILACKNNCAVLLSSGEALNVELSQVFSTMP